MPQGPAIVQPLCRLERVGLLALLAAAVVLGAMTVKRTAFSQLRRGDYEVYARAGWAVRAGENLRDGASSRGWHYVYPPPLAVLMVPLADPPPEVQGATVLPFAASAAIWFVINVLCLLIAVHVLASALEQTSSDPVLRDTSFRRRGWWQLRILPMLACLPVVGETLSRGQVNIILLALVCGFIASMIRGRAFRAGVCLAGAICLKFIPVFLLLVPLWRRDGRCLAGCAAGLILIGLGIPFLGMGVEDTLYDYREFYDVVLAPGLGIAEGRFDDELTSITCGHSQSTMSVIHSWVNPERACRPEEIPEWTRSIHWLLGGGLVLLLLGMAMDQCGWLKRPGSRRSPGPTMPLATRLALFTGLVQLNELFLSPMCHSHYLCQAIPAFTALLFWDWQSRPSRFISRGLAGLMVVYAVANTIPLIPGLILLDDGGMAGIAMLFVWIAGVITLWQTRPQVSEMPHDLHAASGFRVDSAHEPNLQTCTLPAISAAARQR